MGVNVTLPPERPDDCDPVEAQGVLDAVAGRMFGATAQPLRVGRFILLERIGRGGMGVVYAAYDPQLDRKIAVKLLTAPGQRDDASAQDDRRLVREARAAARLDHPNVVTIHEVGTWEGRVFLAMELVHGQTLKAWLAAAPRTRAETLAVFVQAGHGLAAAHAADVVHRDFKPENVLVGGDGKVRVVDFGLARTSAREGVATMPQGASASDSELTRTGAIMGTPAYMAPEQHRGEEASAAADQFAFCVALWEGLYGERPFAGRTMLEIGAHVLAGRLRSPVKGRAVPSRLRRACERGLAVDPRERWPTMGALLEELQRFAAPRARRWLVLGTSGLVCLGGGLAAARYVEVMDRCTGARAQLDDTWDAARRHAVRTAILDTGLSYAPGTWERVEARLDGYAEAWADQLTEVCEATRVTQVQSEATMELRSSCLRGRKTALRATVDVLAAANEEVVERAVELMAGLPRLDRCADVDLLAQQRQRVPPPEDPQVAQEVEALRMQLAHIEAEQRAGKYAHALAQVEPVVQRAAALGYPPLVAEAWLRRGRLLEKDSKHAYAEAEQDLEAAYGLALELELDEVALDAAQRLIFVVGDRQARHAEGLAWGRTAALPLARRRGDALELATSSNNLGAVLRNAGDLEAAQRHLEHAVSIRQEVLGADHPDLAASLNNLGNVLLERGDHEQATRHLQRALRIKEAALGPDHPHVASSANNLGGVLSLRGDYEQAARQHARALQILELALGADHPDLAASASNLGNALSMQGKHEAATLHLQRALRLKEAALGADHPGLAAYVRNVGLGFLRHGKLEPAELYLRRELQIREQAQGAEHADLVLVSSDLGRVSYAQGDYEQAARHHQRALRILEAARGTDHPDLAAPLVGLATVALAQLQLEVARAHAERAVSLCEASAPPPERLAEARFVLARALGSTEPSRARALAEQARDAFAAIGERTAHERVEIEQWLAEHGVQEGGRFP